ncbi:MAG TPA: hypothetical protein DCL35_00990 [Candidatus Omnitrophica bacterium]|nr:hypothetical protein [Candidatus Omnitrophota bacterium]
MPDGNLTPEEKLLRIIESPPGRTGPMRPQRRSQDLQITWKLLRAKYGDKVKVLLNAKAVNALLVFLGTLATLFLVIDFWLGIPRASSVERIEALAKAQAVWDLTIERLDPLAVYMQEITQRNIFSLAPEPTSEQPAPVRPAVSQERALKITENLKVVGIIWSEVPQVIIENISEQRTHLLSRGGLIMGARVKEILKDRVILSYDSQEIELR